MEINDLKISNKNTFSDDKTGALTDAAEWSRLDTLLINIILFLNFQNF